KREDRLRLAYICIIVGFVMAQDAQVFIPREYIILAMDITKLQKYLWGIHAYDFLVENVIKTRHKLSRMKGYHLDGQSQISRTLLATRIGTEDTFVPRCTKWKGIARVSYNDISQLESTFKSHHVLFPYISATGNFDMNDGRVDLLKTMISHETNWNAQVWEIEDAVNEVTDGEQDQDDLESEHEEENEVVNAESDIGTQSGVGVSASGSARGKKRVGDPGATARKQKLLCERSRENVKVLDEDIKTFFQGLVQDSIRSLEEKIGKKIDERLNQIENQITLSMEKLHKSITIVGIPLLLRSL
ncbi:hypothetical protein EUTSA_v10002348mg, partial [Eutrema salsugineum]